MKTYELDQTYWLSTEGFQFRYRKDKYNPLLIHVEMFKDGEKVHKEIVKGYGMDRSHSDIVNALESKIFLKKFDPSGLNQIIP